MPGWLSVVFFQADAVRNRVSCGGVVMRVPVSATVVMPPTSQPLETDSLHFAVVA